MSYQLVTGEYAAVDGVPLDTPAWRTRNLFVLWAGPATRGQDRVVPGAAGVLAKPRRAASRRVSLEMAVFGSVDWTGAPAVDERAGLWANVAHLRSNVTDPTGVGDGTRTLVLFTPAGTVAGPVHVEGFEVGGLGPGAVTAVMDLVIVQGVLA